MAFRTEWDEKSAVRRRLACTKCEFRTSWRSELDDSKLRQEAMKHDCKDK